MTMTRQTIIHDFTHANRCFHKSEKQPINGKIKISHRTFASAPTKVCTHKCVNINIRGHFHRHLNGYFYITKKDLFSMKNIL